MAIGRAIRALRFAASPRCAGNNARSVGGGIGLFGSNAQKYRNVVEMSGGEISGNTAGNKGGGVYLQAAGDEFYMTDGVVAGNEAQRAGGISINAGFSGERTDAIAGLLGGSVRDNVAKGAVTLRLTMRRSARISATPSSRAAHFTWTVPVPLSRATFAWPARSMQAAMPFRPTVS